MIFKEITRMSTNFCRYLQDKVEYKCKIMLGIPIKLDNHQDSKLSLSVIHQNENNQNLS